MVHYTSRRGYPTEYWKLVKPDWPTGKDHRPRLQEKRFAIASSSYTAHRMTYLISRCDRGMMSYEKRNKTDLKLFCQARGIKLPFAKGLKKAALISLLEGEDEEGTTFRYFLDLPPELRLRIYEHYFSAFENGLVNLQWLGIILQPPPISQVCRLLRQETLPLFEKLYCFTIGYERYNRSGRNRCDALLKAPSHLIGLVRKLRITGDIVTRGFTFNATWEIDLPMGERPLKVTRTSLEGEHRGADAPAQLAQEVGNTLDHQMYAFLRHVKDRQPTGRTMRLSLNDYDHIRKIFTLSESSLNLHAEFMSFSAS